MKRKTVKHGNSTLSISLPSKWVKSNRIKAGQHLNIEQSDQKIIIHTEGNFTEKLELTLSGDKEWYVHRMLRHLYTYGYDDVIVNYKSKEQLALLRKSIDGLPGFEIVDSNPKFCHIKCVSSLESAEYEDTVRRVLWLTLSQLDYFIEDCEKKKPIMFEEVRELFRTTMKLINLCRRLINKKPSYDSATSKYSYRFLTSLMNIASFVTYSYEYAAKENRLNLSQKEFDLIKKVRDFYHDLLMAYQNLNIEKTKSFFEKREAMFDEVLELLKDKNPIITHYFLDILKELSSIGNLLLILKINEDNKKIS